MENYEADHTTRFSGATGFAAGLLVGGLAGAGAMLLLAPQSGVRTRVQIRRKSLDLRDQAVEGVEETMEQVRTTSEQITAGVRKQAEKIQQRGLHSVDVQKERWAPVVEAGKNAVKGA
jgi:gas vesicle protein